MKLLPCTVYRVPVHGGHLAATIVSHNTGPVIHRACVVGSSRGLADVGNCGGSLLTVRIQKIGANPAAASRSHAPIGAPWH
ncbi:hypothetical protein B0G73_1238 [Paraburkholderia sp. BL25I1N1]|nr:hypothetical protein B0G73_1238 [Paraburkholderia sp. BL25I1N1]